MSLTNNQKDILKENYEYIEQQTTTTENQHLLANSSNNDLI